MMKNLAGDFAQCVSYLFHTCFIPVSYLFHTSVGHLGSGCARAPVRSERNRAAQNAKQKRIRLRLEDLDQNSSSESGSASSSSSCSASHSNASRACPDIHVPFHTSKRVPFHTLDKGYETDAPVSYV